MLFVVFLEVCSLSHQVFAVDLLHNWGSGQQKRQSHSVSVGTKPHTGTCTINPSQMLFHSKLIWAPAYLLPLFVSLKKKKKGRKK